MDQWTSRSGAALRPRICRMRALRASRKPTSTFREMRPSWRAASAASLLFSPTAPSPIDRIRDLTTSRSRYQLEFSAWSDQISPRRGSCFPSTPKPALRTSCSSMLPLDSGRMWSRAPSTPTSIMSSSRRSSRVFGRLCKKSWAAKSLNSSTTSAEAKW